MSYLGIDVGTTGCKVLAFSQEGDVLARAYREYPLVSPLEGWAELDAEVVWRAVRDNIREVTMTLRRDPPRALALATLGEAVVPVDMNGRPLSNSLVSFDNRGQEQFKRFTAQVSDDFVFEMCGLFPLPHYTIFKLMWWRDERPELYREAWKFLCYGDYIGVRLGLMPLIDHSMATRTLAFDIHKRYWSPELLAFAGIAVEKLPATAPSGTVVGEMPSDVTDSLNLPRGTVLVLGGIDQACAALGAGAVNGGDTLLSMGTVAAVGPVFRAPTDLMRMHRIFSMPHVVRGLCFSVGATAGGGAVLRWYRDEFGYEEREIARRTGRDPFEVLTSLVKDEPTDLLVLPHLSGSRFAFDDPCARGAILGLTFATRKSDLVRAMLEGVAYELCLIRERFERAGLPIPDLRAVGGGSRSDTWMQIIADSLGAVLNAISNPEAGALGAALLSAKALGGSQSLEEAAKAIVRVRRTFEPRREWVAYHAPRVSAYRRAYAQLKDILPPSNLVSKM